MAASVSSASGASFTFDQMKQIVSLMQQQNGQQAQQNNPQQAVQRRAQAFSQTMNTLQATGYGQVMNEVLTDLGNVSNRIQNLNGPGGPFLSSTGQINNPFSTNGAPAQPCNPPTFSQRMLYELQNMPLQFNTPVSAVNSVLNDMSAFSRGFSAPAASYNPFSQAPVYGNNAYTNGYQAPGYQFMGLGNPYYYPNITALQSPGSIFNMTPAAMMTMMA